MLLVEGMEEGGEEEEEGWKYGAGGELGEVLCARERVEEVDHEDESDGRIKDEVAHDVCLGRWRSIREYTDLFFEALFIVKSQWLQGRARERCVSNWTLDIRSCVGGPRT